MNIPFMPFYWGDYLRDTGHLTLAQHGAYLLLIGHYWCNGSVPGDDDEQMAAITRQSVQAWLTMRPTIAAFFAPGWRHRRVDFELAKAFDKIEKRRAAGKKGGEASGAARNRLQWEANASNHLLDRNNQRRQAHEPEPNASPRSNWFTKQMLQNEANASEANVKQTSTIQNQKSKKERLETEAPTACGKPEVVHSNTKTPLPDNDLNGKSSTGSLATARFETRARSPEQDRAESTTPVPPPPAISEAWRQLLESPDYKPKGRLQ